MPDTLHKSCTGDRPAWKHWATQCVFLAFVVTLGGWTTPASSQSPGKQTAATAPAARIMVYGDSLSAAYNIDPAKGWVALMADRLKQTQPKVVVINASISGETTTGGRSRLATDLARHKPTHVLLQLGANDALRGLPLSATRSNLDAMLQQIRSAGAVPVLIGIQIPPNYGPEYSQEFRNLYPELAKQRKTALVPFLLEGIADKPELFLPDGLHPAVAAQPRLLENVWPVLQTALRGKSA
ncbi:MAG: arylesterase [Burkholderiales bacterium]|nr:arylesterase [Burkholderiales bacterium]